MEHDKDQGDLISSTELTASLSTILQEIRELKKLVLEKHSNAFHENEINTSILPEGSPHD